MKALFSFSWPYCITVAFRPSGIYCRVLFPPTEQSRNETNINTQHVKVVTEQKLETLLQTKSHEYD